MELRAETGKRSEDDTRSVTTRDSSHNSYNVYKSASREIPYSSSQSRDERRFGLLPSEEAKNLNKSRMQMATLANDSSRIQKHITEFNQSQESDVKKLEIGRDILDQFQKLRSSLIAKSSELTDEMRTDGVIGMHFKKAENTLSAKNEMRKIVSTLESKIFNEKVKALSETVALLEGHEAHIKTYEEQQGTTNKNHLEEILLEKDLLAFKKDVRDSLGRNLAELAQLFPTLAKDNKAQEHIIKVYTTIERISHEIDLHIKKVNDVQRNLERDSPYDEGGKIYQEVSILKDKVLSELSKGTSKIDISVLQNSLKEIGKLEKRYIPVTERMEQVMHNFPLDSSLDNHLYDLGTTDKKRMDAGIASMTRDIHGVIDKSVPKLMTRFHERSMSLIKTVSGIQECLTEISEQNPSADKFHQHTIQDVLKQSESMAKEVEFFTSYPLKESDAQKRDYHLYVFKSEISDKMDHYISNIEGLATKIASNLRKDRVGSEIDEQLKQLYLTRQTLANDQTHSFTLSELSELYQDNEFLHQHYNSHVQFIKKLSEQFTSVGNHPRDLQALNRWVNHDERLHRIQENLIEEIKTSLEERIHEKRIHENNILKEIQDLEGQSDKDNMDLNYKRLRGELMNVDDLELVRNVGKYYAKIAKAIENSEGEFSRQLGRDNYLKVVQARIKDNQSDFENDLKNSLPSQSSRDFHASIKSLHDQIAREKGTYPKASFRRDLESYRLEYKRHIQAKSVIDNFSGRNLKYAAKGILDNATQKIEESERYLSRSENYLSRIDNIIANIE